MGGEEKKVWDVTDVFRQNLIFWDLFCQSKSNNMAQSIKFIFMK